MVLLAARLGMVTTVNASHIECAFLRLCSHVCSGWAYSWTAYRSAVAIWPDQVRKGPLGLVAAFAEGQGGGKSWSPQHCRHISQNVCPLWSGLILVSMLRPWLLRLCLVLLNMVDQYGVTEMLTDGCIAWHLVCTKWRKFGEAHFLNSSFYSAFI